MQDCNSLNKNFFVIQFNQLASFMISGGYLGISNVYVNSATDVIPPGKITDFHLVAARSADNSFTLGWTSPGDDYFTGTGKISKYVFVVTRLHWSHGLQLCPSTCYKLFTSAVDHLLMFFEQETLNLSCVAKS